MVANVVSLDWPDGFDRTPRSVRESYPHNFRVSQRQAFENIVTQVERMDGVSGLEIETAADHLERRPNVPRSNASPSDPGVVVRFVRDGERLVFPCDRWSSLRDNAQAIAKYIEAKRALERYGVQTVDSEFGTQKPEKRRID